ncbi:RDD family protein [Streptomyces buecherae]|uniref:RDD family protein n=1 Tax=Streptomyces buecherae TaxID=2763006 RepID=A0A7H8N6J5_9ACTN|nr:RDD family protein [Streptomyces buecherae]QKW50127.1 RDD family protein [Streptomyces buecherae]
MSTDQPQPGSGEPPQDDDPLRKTPQPPSGQPGPGAAGPAAGSGDQPGAGAPGAPGMGQPGAGAPGPFDAAHPGSAASQPGGWPGEGAQGGQGGQGGPPGGGPYNGSPGGGSPYGGPYGGPYGDQPGGGYGGGPPYGGDPYGGDPYGGAADPLAGMPPLGGLGRRLVARIVDGLIVAIPVSVIMLLSLGGYDPTDPDDTGKSSATQIVFALVYFIYEGLMLTTRGQTVGKKLMKLRVAMLDNGANPTGQPGWFRAGTYALPQIVPCCGFLFWLVNILWCTWDRPYRQCLHDKVAKTVVVSTE